MITVWESGSVFDDWVGYFGVFVLFYGLDDG